MTNLLCILCIPKSAIVSGFTCILGAMACMCVWWVSNTKLYIRMYTQAHTHVQTTFLWCWCGFMYVFLLHFLWVILISVNTWDFVRTYYCMAKNHIYSKASDSKCWFSIILSLEWIWVFEKIKYCCSVDGNEGAFHVQTGYSQPTNRDKGEGKCEWDNVITSIQMYTHT